MKRTMVRSAIPFLAAGIALWGLFALLSSPARAEGKNAPAQTVTVVGAWGGIEQESFSAVLDEFTTRTGISISYTQSTNIPDQLLNCTTSGDCPDVAMIPNPKLLRELVKQGALAHLDPIVSDFNSYYTTTWRTLASVGSTLYGCLSKLVPKA